METLTAGDSSVTIDHDRGGRLVSLVAGGHELLVGRDEGWPGSFGWGSFPMAPYAGRVRDGRFTTTTGAEVSLPLTMAPHAIHGTVHDRRWYPTGPGELRTDLGPDWPWPGEVTQTVRLSSDAIESTIRVVHAAGAAGPGAGPGPMPVSLGWHPWFRRRVGGVDVELELHAGSMWRRDDAGIPDGTLVAPGPPPWDDCFTAVSWPVRLHWPGALVLAIESDCDHVVVFDEPDHALCVEPQSAPPDALGSGIDLVLLAPGAAVERRTTWRWLVDH